MKVLGSIPTTSNLLKEDLDDEAATTERGIRYLGGTSPLPSALSSSYGSGTFELEAWNEEKETLRESLNSGREIDLSTISHRI